MISHWKRPRSCSESFTRRKVHDPIRSNTHTRTHARSRRCLSLAPREDGSLRKQRLRRQILGGSTLACFLPRLAKVKSIRVGCGGGGLDIEISPTKHSSSSVFSFGRSLERWSVSSSGIRLDLRSAATARRRRRPKAQLFYECLDWPSQRQQ